MWQLIEANWIAFLIVAVLAVLVALWIIGRSRKPKERSHRPDVLDEGVAPARRNQALIDAPPAVGTPQVTPRQVTPTPAPTPAPASTPAEAPTHHAPAAPPSTDTLRAAVAPAVLSTEPGSNEEIATDHHTTMPDPKAEAEADGTAEEAGVHQSETQATDDREAVAAAIKIHFGEEATNDLSRIKGIGPKLVAMLGSMGISRYDQIAAWSDEDVQKIDAQLGAFQGRIHRDNWREQARYLAEGDTAGYEGKFGKL
jgi:predicted flap endonuclease-1-like 5' DNA nuclease